MELVLAAHGLIEVDFLHGVAAGEPWPSSIVLWSRVTPRAAHGQPLPSNHTVRVHWAVAATDDEAVAQQGEFNTDASRDWTIKLVVDGLESRKPYSYRFSVGDARSPQGRFRLPPPADQPLSALSYGVFSCSHWAWGCAALRLEARTSADLGLGGRIQLRGQHPPGARAHTVRTAVVSAQLLQRLRERGPRGPRLLASPGRLHLRVRAGPLPQHGAGGAVARDEASGRAAHPAAVPAAVRAHA